MRIWWYLAKDFFKITFLLILFSLGLFFVLTYIEDSTHYFPKYDAQGRVIFEYYFWQIPLIFTQLISFAVLIGAVVSIWLFARNGEIAALRCAGMSMYQIAIPFLCVGLFFVASQFAVNELVVPFCQKKFFEVKFVEIQGKSIENSFIKSNWLKSKNSIMHFEKFQEAARQLVDVQYYIYDNKDNLLKTVYAPLAFFDEEKGVWVLVNSSATLFNNPNRFLTTIFDSQFETEIDFEPPKVLREKADSNQLSYLQLRSLIRQAQEAGTNVSGREIDLHLKLSAPFANFLFVFLAFPFALRKERQKETYLGFIICIAAALIYWFGNLTLRNMSVNGIVDPLIAAWAMNILLGILSFLMVRKLDKGS
ncbi:MAG: LptF/LptG family permease [Silvanigrellaceae bacterium]|nr:LptF/LptG family permease [Silvanigrellaceae bacterium]